SSPPRSECVNGTIADTAQHAANRSRALELIATNRNSELTTRRKGTDYSPKKSKSGRRHFCRLSLCESACAARKAAGPPSAPMKGRDDIPKRRSGERAVLFHDELGARSPHVHLVFDLLDWGPAVKPTHAVSCG